MRIVQDPHLSTSSHEEPLDRFLEAPFRDSDSLEKTLRKILKRSYPRQELVSILDKYNRDIGNDEMALENIHRLKEEDTVSIVTGQQLGLMGGPAFTILKGISCLLMARQTGAIPIFWLATEDHDVSEIDHTYLLDPYGNLANFHLTLPKDGRPVEDLKLTEKNIEVIHHFLRSANVLPDFWPEMTDSYSQTMAQFLVKLFAGTGMVFLEPKYLRPLATSFFCRELEESFSLIQILKQTTEDLVSDGGEAVISFKGTTNLFLKDDSGRRLVISRDGEQFHSGGVKYTLAEIKRLVRNEPMRFSTNVASRPVLQSHLIPTLAYIAGPTELAYYRQLGRYHSSHGVPMPCIVPRLSATFIPNYAAEILEKCRLDPSAVLPQSWLDLYPEIKVAVSEMAKEWHQSAVDHFGDEAPSHFYERIIHIGERKMQKALIKRHLKKNGIPFYGLHLLKNLIYPQGKKQERVLNWCSFQATTSNNLIKECLKLPALKADGHLFIYS